VLREELLSELDVAFREAFPDRAARLLREVDRWCREAPDPATRDWRWFDAGADGDEPGKGKFDRERVASFRCSFCARSLLQATRLIGMRVGARAGEPHLTLEGYRHPKDRTPSGGERPPMMCNFCVDAYHERFADEEFFSSKLPNPDMLIADAGRALRSRRSEHADDVMRELERRRALALPRDLSTGACALCARADARLVRGPVLEVCSRCIGRARYTVSSVIAVSVSSG
jgi:hypothetical protein